METKNNHHFTSSYGFKMIIISGLAILLLIPSFLIQEIIQERISLSEKVKYELYSQWGNKQVISGPVLNIPYSVTIAASDNRQIVETRSGVAHFLPELLETDGVLYPEKRKRGIYEVVVYESRIILKGSFTPPDVSQLNLSNAQYFWDEAYFTLGISDMRGIKNMPELVINGQKLKVDPGVADADLFASGITVKSRAIDLNQALNFELELVLNGSENFSVEALGKTSKVHLKSDWSQPSFTGAFLPADRQVTGQGFTANWLVTHLNRNFPQQWADRRYVTNESGLGVELLIPVDHYQKSMRSAKYAILFIALNFIIFIFIEIKSKTKIHPFQYLMVALALLIFYVLLTSIGEQIGFNLAYLVSALAVTMLIAWYAFNLFRNIRLAAWVTLFQTGLYLFIFTILQLQDYALLAGSIGLFVILAIIMKASQKIKWYSEG